MSVLFVADDRCVWNPANTVADLYRRTAIAGGELIATPTGLGEVCADECAIDPHQWEPSPPPYFGGVTRPRTTRCRTRWWTVVAPRRSSSWNAATSQLASRTDPLTDSGADTPYWRSFMERHTAHMPR